MTLLRREEASSDDAHFCLADPNCHINRLLARELRVEMHALGHTESEQDKCTPEDVMVWCVLCGRYGLAEELWKRCTSPLRAGIVSANIFRMLATHPGLGLSADARSLMQEQSDKFERLCLGLIKCMFAADVHRTMNRLEMPWPGNDELTAVDVVSEFAHQKKVSKLLWIC